MSDDNQKKENSKEKPRRHWFIKVLKTLMWVIIAVLFLFTGVCSAIVWILTPAKLTPIVEKYATEYLNAEVKISRVELTFWHTFPKMTLDVDSLTIISHSIPDGLRDNLPANTDTLLTLDNFHGGINAAALSIGKIELYNVIFDGPKINLFKLNDNLSNYDIIPTSGEETAESESMPIEDISINKFAIYNAAPIRYRSLSDSIDIEINIENITLNGKQAPCYAIQVTANGKTPLLDMFNLDNLPLSISGTVDWNQKSPRTVALNDFTIKVDALEADFSTSIDITDTIVVNEFTCELPHWDVSWLLNRLPNEYTSAIRGLDTDMKISMSARLTEPYAITDSSEILPSLKGSIDIPGCHIYQGRLCFNKVQFNADYIYNGTNPDKSTIDINKFIIDGKAMDIDLKAKIRTPISDPSINGSLKAGFDVTQMPETFLEKIAQRIHGKINADVTLDMKMSDLNQERFHHLKIDGEVNLNDFHYLSTDTITNIYARNSTLKFGSNRTIERGENTIDSMLTASVEVDTAHIIYASTTIDFNGFKSRVGTRLTNENRDSTAVMPFGGSISFKKLKLHDSVDSIRLHLKDIRTRASLRRYLGDSHAPQLSFAVDAGRISAGVKRDMAVSLRKGHFDITSSYIKPRVRSVNDSTSSRRKRVKSTTLIEDDDDLDLSVDSGLKRILRRWDINGSFRAESGRFYTSAIPAKNRLKNVDFSFTTDSLELHNTRYQVGQSDFTINGSITNLKRVLMGRKRNNTLKILFKVNSDTLNINEISRMLITDMSPTDIGEDLAVLDDDDAEIAISPDTTDLTTSAFMVPGNIDAVIRFKADNVIYTNMFLNNFTCTILMRDKILNLRRLAAKAELGDIDLSALYTTQIKDSIQFGMGLKINRLQLDKMTSFIPALDTLMPLLKEFSGIVNADIAATTQIDNEMNFVMPSLQAAIKLSGDSLVLLDPDTFKFLSKWLMFKNKEKNMIDKMSVDIIVENNTLQLFPFIFDIDRYRLGVMGSNDMAMNLNYHISVLKSPLPFKFGINISGNIDDMKIRLGGAKFKDNMAIQTMSIADTTRVNLVNEIENVFRRSARAPLRLNRGNANIKSQLDSVETISAEDSIKMIKEGFIEAPTPPDSLSKISQQNTNGKTGKKNKR